jgi:hypothetical protein
VGCNGFCYPFSESDLTSVRNRSTSRNLTMRDYCQEAVPLRPPAVRRRQGDNQHQAQTFPINKSKSWKKVTIQWRINWSRRAWMAFSWASANSCRILLSASRRAQFVASLCTSLIHYQSNFNMKYRSYHFSALKSLESNS